MSEAKMTESPRVEAEGEYLIVNGTVMTDTPENREMAREMILDRH